MPSLPSQFLSCDWGTSSFRLRLVQGGQILTELSEPIGVKSIFDSAQQPQDRPEMFANFMRMKLESLAARSSIVNTTPLIISGMASSSIGWKELPYARAPFSLDGSGLEVEQLGWNGPGWLGSTFLVSGVATESEMIRGEECQIIGLLDDPQWAHLRRCCLLILPGTHSKHIWIENEKVVRFRTYMTGELFQVLATQSILRATTNAAEPIHKHRRTFGEGCEYVRQNGLAASLFQARTRGVLKHTSPEENAAFLSGLLIGAEVADVAQTNCPRVIAAKPELLEPYSLALSALLISQIDGATVNGHRMLLANLSK